jgi:hypothetical protein
MTFRALVCLLAAKQRIEATAIEIFLAERALPASVAKLVETVATSNA